MRREWVVDAVAVGVVNVSIGRIIGVFQLCLILVRYVNQGSLPRATSESIPQALGTGKSGVGCAVFGGETGLPGELKGYEEYAAKVRYKLIPGVW